MVRQRRMHRGKFDYFFGAFTTCKYVIGTIIADQVSLTFEEQAFYLHSILQEMCLCAKNKYLRVHYNYTKMSTKHV